MATGTERFTGSCATRSRASPSTARRSDVVALISSLLLAACASGGGEPLVIGPSRPFTLLFLNATCNQCPADPPPARVRDALERHSPQAAAIIGLDSEAAVRAAIPAERYQVEYYGLPGRAGQDPASPFFGLVMAAARDHFFLWSSYEWLSPTPEVPRSTFDGEAPMVIARGGLRDKASQREIVFSSSSLEGHAEERSAALLRERADAPAPSLVAATLGFLSNSPEYSGAFAGTFLNAHDVAEVKDAIAPGLVDHVLLDADGKWRVLRFTFEQGTDPRLHPVVVVELQEFLAR